MSRLQAVGLLAAAFAVCPSPAAAGEVAIGVNSVGDPELVRFDTDTPGTLTARVPIEGLLGSEAVDGIDLRPATGEVFALTSFNRVLVLDPETGATTQAGAAIDGSLLGSGLPVGVDFNPTVDRMRIVSAAEENLRFNPITFAPVDGDAGTAGTQPDTDLAFISTDVNFGSNPSVLAEAYSNNDNDGTTPTTLYGIDASLGVLVRHGAVDGNAGDVAGGGSPNGGLLTTIGPLGLTAFDAALDIVRGSSPGGNVAYAVVRPSMVGGTLLYRIALGNGAATPLGVIGDGTPRLSGMTIMVGGDIRVAALSTPTSEPAGQVTVEVTRTGDTLAPAAVAYRTADRTAVAGRDYTAVSGTLQFFENQRSKTVTIPISQDADVEGTEALALVLGPSSGGAVVETHEHTIELVDDDRPASVPDTTRPSFVLAPALPRSLRALRQARRLRLEVAGSEACRIALTLKLGRKRLGRAVAVLAGPGVKAATVRLTTAGRRVLARALRSRSRRAVRLTLTGVATDAAGNRRTRTVKLRLARR
jgi:hypothetical protein